MCRGTVTLVVYQLIVSAAAAVTRAASSHSRCLAQARFVLTLQEWKPPSRAVLDSERTFVDVDASTLLAVWVTSFQVYPVSEHEASRTQAQCPDGWLDCWRSRGGVEKARVGKSACDCGAFIWDRTLQTCAPWPLKTSLTGHGIGPRPRGDATVVVEL